MNRNNNINKCYITILVLGVLALALMLVLLAFNSNNIEKTKTDLDRKTEAAFEERSKLIKDIKTKGLGTANICCDLSSSLMDGIEACMDNSENKEIRVITGLAIIKNKIDKTVPKYFHRKSDIICINNCNKVLVGTYKYLAFDSRSNNDVEVEINCKDFINGCDYKISTLD